MMCWHFWDVHPLDLVIVPKEGRYSRCKRCGMQVNPLYPRHRYSKECQVRVEHRKQCKMAVSSALALCQQLTVCRDVLERVEVYKYLGRLMAQDDDNIQAIWAQIWKALATWARVGQVLRSKKPCHSWPRSSTRLLSKPFFFTAARHGLSLKPPLHGSRGSTFERPIGGRRQISPSMAQAMCGSTQGRRMF
jgi:hypothetical protein